MNILFALKHYTVGGVEVVSQILAEEFCRRNHRVTFLSFEAPSEILAARLNPSIKIVTLESDACSAKNIKLVKALLVEGGVDIVINQWGQPFAPTCLLNRARKGTDSIYISVQHNTPGANERLAKIDQALSGTKGLRRVLYKTWRHVVYQVTSHSMRYVYGKSDAFVLLSRSHVPLFREYTKLRDPIKLRVIGNPCCVDAVYHCGVDNKQKEVVYVGRLSRTQKRVDRIIEVWSRIECAVPDWKLTIVGDGMDRNAIVQQIQRLRLRNVAVVGYQDPVQYYKTASAIIMTSEYEGFPLVLLEAMSNGVVPVVYGSFPAVFDIITTGRDGLIVPPKNGQFCADDMAKQLKGLITDQDRLESMSRNAQISSRCYSVDSIYQHWEALFNELSNAQLSKGNTASR